MTPKFHYSKTWQMNYYFFIGWSWEDFGKYYRKTFGLELPQYSGQSGYTIMVENNKSCRVLIWVKNPKSFSIIAHECLHAVNMTLHRAGYRVDLTNDEAQAYTLTELMQATGCK